MPKLSPTVRRTLIGAALLTALCAPLLSRSMRTSLGAAWIAFRDPTRVRSPEDAPLPAPVPALLELAEPDLSGDFARVGEVDVGDAGALASFVQPALPIPITRRTLRFVSWFSADPRGRQAFAERFRRAGRYRAHVEQALRDAEAPEDLLWLVAIVSGFEPLATSPKGAAGLFQFMPETAARFGLAQSEWVDERRSIPRSTQAGVKLLRELFDRYQQWDLALAAYNMGHENLDEAIAGLKKRRGPREAKKPIELADLAEARLVPKETASFVPQVQAFALVAANRGRFGLDDLDVAPPLSLAEIAVPPETPIQLVARAASVSVATLRDCNPELLRDRTPPGSSDVMINVPADKLPTALVALPVLLARERARAAAASASASGSSAPAEPPRASASADEPAAPPPVERFTLPNGVVVERRSAPGPEVILGARVEVAGSLRGAPRPGDPAFGVDPVTARAGDLGAGIDRVAREVHRLIAGEAAIAARRTTGAPRRAALDKAPYGSAWLALGDRLFGAGSPLAGAVLAAPTMPLQAVTIADPGAESAAFRAPLRITLTASGPVDRAALAPLVTRAFTGGAPSPGAVSALSREERIELSLTVPSPRVLFAWLAPSADEGDRAGLMLAMLALAHDEHGRVARALGAETHVAVRVRGLLDVGDVASVAAIEAAPSVLHDVAAVERELDRALDGFAACGPTEAELVTAKEQLRARFQAARGRAGQGGDPREVTIARIARHEERAAAVTAAELGALVGRVFAKGRRVVVVSRPRR